MLLKCTAAAIITTLVNGLRKQTSNTDGEKRYDGYIIDDDVTFLSSCVLNTIEDET